MTPFSVCSVPRAENGGPEKLDLGDLFPSEFTQELRRLIRRADRMGSTSAQMEVTLARPPWCWR